MKRHFDSPISLFLLLIFVFISGCFSPIDRPKPKEPEKPTLPLETQTGANTFGCYVNGNLWLPGGEGVAGNGITWSHSYQDQISIAGKKRYKLNDQMVNERISFGILNGITGEGIYYLVGEERGGSFYKDFPNYCSLRTDSINSGILEITRWDMEHLIVSGRFSYTVTAPDCDTIRVTDGRFDIKL